MKHALPAFLALALGACATVPATESAPRAVTVQILGLNDFHGALQPPNQSVFFANDEGEVERAPAGGAAYLADALETLREGQANTMTVGAGDMTGASQLASALFLDEPTVTVLSRIGLEFNAVGNHEFDRGWRELKRLQEGGCEKLAKRDPCQLEEFEGASFSYLAANVTMPDGSTLFPATALKRFGSGDSEVTIGLIGLTLKGTDKIVSPAGIQGIAFGDEVPAINRSVEALDAQGADAIVVLIHQGIKTMALPDPQGCDAPQDALIPILEAMDPRVDVVISGHTHWSYICNWPSKQEGHTFLLTSAGLFGELVTDITLEIDPIGGEVTAKSARNVIVQSQPYRSSTRDVPLNEKLPRFEPDPEIASYVALYSDAAKEFTQRPVGKISGTAEKGSGAQSNMGKALGRLIADAQLAATQDSGAQIAFMNPFGIRNPLNPAQDGSLTYGDLAATQPFNNELVTQSFTGAQIKRLLEQQFEGEDPEQFLAPSKGFAFTFDRSRPLGQRITAISLNGVPIDPDRTYRVTTNSFIANGGDSFSVLTEGKDKVITGTDIDALEAYIRSVEVRAVPTDDGITDATPQQ